METSTVVAPYSGRMSGAHVVPTFTDQELERWVAAAKSGELRYIFALNDGKHFQYLRWLEGKQEVEG